MTAIARYFQYMTAQATLAPLPAHREHSYVPVSSISDIADLPECVRLHETLKNRIAAITTGPLIEQFQQTALNYMKRAVDEAYAMGNLNLLRVYDTHMSEEVTPYELRQVALSMIRNGLHSPSNINEAYLSITQRHLDAYHLVKQSSLFTRGYRFQGQIIDLAMRYPDRVDQVLELVSRGLLDPVELAAAIESMDFGLSVPLQNGSL